MGSSKRPLILFATSFFGQPVEVDASRCGDACEFTNDRNRVAEAAAVVFHIPSLHEVPWAKKYPGQLWVAWSMESVANFRQLVDPVFLANFDLRMTYELSADAWCPYLPYPEQWEQALATPIAPKTAAATAVMFQSAALNDSGRNEFASELMSLIQVDSFGRFLNNRRLEVPDEGGKTKLAVISAYNFCLGLENSICTDYVTEKFYDPFLAGTVPVYRGAPNNDDFAPGPHSYINADDCAG
ncbi:MAG: glycosyltransferase family 10, partial [Dehalococcoidia bacterium]